MGIFDRISSVFKANVNHLLSKAEDPEKMLDQIVLEMNEQLAKTKRQVTVAIADEKRLEKQYRSEETEAQEWERKATLALQKENETLAKEALARRNEHQNLANEYKTQWEKQKGICPYTGIELVQPKDCNDEAMYKKASLDRIDSKLGYVKGNIQFISASANYAKGTMTDEEMVEFCKLITNHWSKDTR